LPQFLASPVIFTNWGKQGVTKFMTRRITYLMEEQENISKLLNTRDLDVEAIRALEEPHKTEIPNPYDEGVLPSLGRRIGS
jgi:hypothetical protein